MLCTGITGCVSCDVTAEDMKEKGDALILNKAMLERAANKNDQKVIFTFKIVKK